KPPTTLIPGEETTGEETTGEETTGEETTGEETTREETTREERTTEETNATEAVQQAVTDPTRILDGIVEYEAPIFVWDKEVLKKGETTSEQIKQTPIKLPNGGTEDNKAIMVKRGDWVTSDRGSGFVLNPEGKNFEITLFANGVEKGKASGILLKPSYGCAMWCRDAKPGEVVSNPELTGEFNCYFKTTLKEDGGVQVLWTMLHPEH
ncbi:MAG TPA: hypothetical protein VD710_01025, partial [Nitrososphaeraceae archaeon]|nr:hypothetical protein [Nitrososphaeraceae archaeon]